jgi:hypothetical protein
MNHTSARPMQEKREKGGDVFLFLLLGQQEVEWQ